MRNDFEPKHLKKAREALGKHLKVVEIHANTNEDYKKGILKEPSLWYRLIHLFKG